MRLNLGCGWRHESDWVNVDKEPACKPDLCLDLEDSPWPIENNVATEVRAWHVLEHIGESTAAYLGFVKELYRVCTDEASIDIRVPHFRHNDFWSDPTHTRPITEGGLWLFSRAANAIAIANKWASTPLGMYANVDFEIRGVTNVLDPKWHSQWVNKEIDSEYLASAAASLNNVVQEVRIEMRVVKPPGRTIGIFQPPMGVPA